MAEKETIHRLTNALIVMTLIVFALVALVVYLAIIRDHPEEEDVAFCGVIEPESSFYSDTPDPKYQHTLKLLKINCTACHDLGNRQLIAPGLVGLSKRIPNEDWLREYLTDQRALIARGDTYALALQAAYPKMNWMHPGARLSEEEVRRMAEYLYMQ